MVSGGNGHSVDEEGGVRIELEPTVHDPFAMLTEPELPVTA